jgi:hypothetical protein
VLCNFSQVLQSLSFALQISWQVLQSFSFALQISSQVLQKVSLTRDNAKVVFLLSKYLLFPTFQANRSVFAINALQRCNPFVAPFVQSVADGSLFFSLISLG